MNNSNDSSHYHKFALFDLLKKHIQKKFRFFLDVNASPNVKKRHSYEQQSTESTLLLVFRFPISVCLQFQNNLIKILVQVTLVNRTPLKIFSFMQSNIKPFFSTVTSRTQSDDVTFRERQLLLLLLINNEKPLGQWIFH